MADEDRKEGFFISNKLIGLLIIGLLGGGGAIGIGGFSLSSGASDAATEDIKQVIQDVLKTEAMLTPEEAEEWADERDTQNRHAEHIDETLEQHSKDITEIKEDVAMVQRSVDMNQAVLQTIADKIGVNE